MAAAIAVFDTNQIVGNTVAKETPTGVTITATFTKLPPGKHGFHIHTAGDLRAPGCVGACAHFHVGAPAIHGDRPSRDNKDNIKQRHTGDLGNIELTSDSVSYRYHLDGLKAADLWGRSLIVHADEDDLGQGPHEDSKITGHSGARIGCAIFGRTMVSAKTRKLKVANKSKPHYER
jgi:Cu-Zn family superoxide dismutase